MEKISKNFLIVFFLFIMGCAPSLEFVADNGQEFKQKDLLSKPYKLKVPDSLKQIVKISNYSKYTSYFTYTTIPEKLMGDNVKPMYKDEKGIMVFQSVNKLYVYLPLNRVELDYNQVSLVSEEGFVGALFVFK